MDKIILIAEKRKEFTKSSRNQLRNNGKVLATVYSKHIEPISVSVDEVKVNPLVFTSKTHLISLQVEGVEPIDCVIKDTQFDPVTDKVIHLDFQALTKGEKIEIEVPIVFEGSPIGVKEGGMLQQLLHKVTVNCEPADIPEHIVIAIGNLKLGEAIHIKDLDIQGVEFLHAPDTILVTITHPRAEAEGAGEEGEAAAEPEVISKGKKEEE